MFFFLAKEETRKKKIDKPLPLRQNGRSANKLNEDYTTTTDSDRLLFFPAGYFIDRVQLAAKLRLRTAFRRRIRRWQWKIPELFFSTELLRFEIVCLLKELCLVVFISVGKCFLLAFPPRFERRAIL